ECPVPASPVTRPTPCTWSGPVLPKSATSLMVATARSRSFSVFSASSFCFCTSMQPSAHKQHKPSAPMDRNMAETPHLDRDFERQGNTLDGEICQGKTDPRLRIRKSLPIHVLNRPLQSKADI